MQTQPLIPKTLTARWAGFWLAYPITGLVLTFLAAATGQSSPFALDPSALLFGFFVNFVFGALVYAMCRKALWLFPVLVALIAFCLSVGLRALVLRGHEMNWSYEISAGMMSALTAFIGGIATWLIWRYVVPRLP